MMRTIRWPFATRGGLGKRLARGAAGIGALKLISMPLTLLTSVLLARGLGPEVFGRYSMVIAATTLISLLPGPGLAQLFTRESARLSSARRWSELRGFLTRSRQWVWLTSALLLFLIATVSMPRAQWQAQDIWTMAVLAVLLIPLFGMSALRGGVLRGLGHPVLAQLPELLSRPVVHFVLVAILWWLGALTGVSAVASLVAAGAVCWVLGEWLLRRCRPDELARDASAYRTSQWFRSVPPFLLLAAVAAVNDQVAILALGALSGDAEVAALRVAVSGAMLVALPLSITSLLIAPDLARAYAENDRTLLVKIFKISTRWAAFASLIIALPLWFAPWSILSVVFGPEYREIAAAPLVWLAAGQFANVVFGPVGMLLMMTGHERYTLLGQAVAVVLLVGLLLALIPQFGATGAAVAQTLGILTWNTFLAIVAWRRLNIRFAIL